MKGEILTLLSAATARLWAQMEGCCEQVQQTSNCPTWLLRGSHSLPSRFHGEVLVHPSTPSPVDSWLRLQNRQWQAGCPWDSYLNSLTHPFLKEEFERKGKSSRKTHTGISSALPSTASLCCIFFPFWLFFKLWYLPPTFTLLLWNSNAKVSFSFS